MSRYIVTGFTTITGELEKVIREDYNLKNKKIGVWSSGVSIEDFNNSDINQNNIVYEKNKKFTLLYHGDYSPTRGIEDLIKSIGKLDSTLKKEILLLIVGIPKNKIIELSKLSYKEGVKHLIKILPKTDYNEIIQYIKNSDIGIIPLPPENRWWQVSAPLKTLEYMAAGKPIIATNIPFHQNIFKKGDCGILIESINHEVIAEAITFSYKNQEKLKKMGSEARKIVKKYYTWDHMAQRFENFLKTV